MFLLLLVPLLAHVVAQEELLPELSVFSADYENVDFFEDFSIDAEKIKSSVVNAELNVFSADYDDTLLFNDDTDFQDIQTAKSRKDLVSHSDKVIEDLFDESIIDNVAKLFPEQVGLGTAGRTFVDQLILSMDYSYDLTDTPTNHPTMMPSRQPTDSPSARPTPVPTNKPTTGPTAATLFKIPPPDLSSACFSNDGRFISVIFSAPSDRAEAVLNPAQSFACDKLFTFPGASEDSCLWTSELSVRATISSTSAFANVGDDFHLKAGTVRAKCPANTDCSLFDYASVQSVSICSPMSPVSPVMRISSPSPVGRCADIQLAVSSSTGQGTAPWKSLVWTVSGDFGPKHLRDIENYLNGIIAASTIRSTSSAFIVRNNEFGVGNGTYTFSFCGTNMFDNTDCVSRDVIVSSNTNIPTVTISKDIVSIYRYQSALFFGSASVASCDGIAVTSGITYNYEIFNATSGVRLTNVVPTSNNPRNFWIPAYSFQPDTNVRLVLTVTSNSGVSNSVDHFFSVLRASTRAIISQGSRTTVYERGSARIDGTQSYDLDFPTVKSDLTYTWTCTKVSGTPSDCPVTFPSVVDIIFDATKFVAEEEYELTLTVRNIKVPNSESTAKIIVAVQEGLPLPTINFLNTLTKYNRDKRIRLDTSISNQFPSLTTQWSVYDSQRNELSISDIILTPLTQQFSAGLSLLSLTTRVNALEEGAAYTFRLTATYVPLQSTTSISTVAEVSKFALRFSLSIFNSICILWSRLLFI